MPQGRAATPIIRTWGLAPQPTPPFPHPTPPPPTCPLTTRPTLPSINLPVLVAQGPEVALRGSLPPRPAQGEPQACLSARCSSELAWGQPHQLTPDSGLPCQGNKLPRRAFSEGSPTPQAPGFTGKEENAFLGAGLGADRGQRHPNAPGLLLGDAMCLTSLLWGIWKSQCLSLSSQPSSPPPIAKRQHAPTHRL